MIQRKAVEDTSEHAGTNDAECVAFLRWALPQLRMRWPGFRKVRRQVCKRIRKRLRELRLTDVPEYREYLERHPPEWSILDSLCRISISRFYRDRGVFDYLRDTGLPELASGLMRTGEPTLRCWSAGCASGEEPYTLAMIWKFCLEQKFPRISFCITATDADERLLERAQAACYTKGSLKDVPQSWQSQAFVQSDDECCLKPEFRANVEFYRQDIRRRLPDGPFHLILCRNLVFTYFDESLQKDIIARVAQRLSAGGLFVIGQHELLPSDVDIFLRRQSNLGVFQVG